MTFNGIGELPISSVIFFKALDDEFLIFLFVAVNIADNLFPLNCVASSLTYIAVENNGAAKIFCGTPKFLFVNFNIGGIKRNYTTFLFAETSKAISVKRNAYIKKCLGEVILFKVEKCLSIYPFLCRKGDFLFCFDFVYVVKITNSAATVNRKSQKI